jgi:hypothetical protein
MAGRQAMLGRVIDRLASWLRTAAAGPMADRDVAGSLVESIVAQ